MTDASELLSACRIALLDLDLMSAREHLTAYRNARASGALQPIGSSDAGIIEGDEYARLLAERIESVRQSLLPSRLT